ncbi:hypothetical protein [Hydrogenophaga sp.]|nr:hypothetical protein [Hydrogenophaga sp.]
MPSERRPRHRVTQSPQMNAELHAERTCDDGHSQIEPFFITFMA